jgi:hypothetical protein
MDYQEKHSFEYIKNDLNKFMVHKVNNNAIDITEFLLNRYLHPRYTISEFTSIIDTIGGSENFTYTPSILQINATIHKLIEIISSSREEAYEKENINIIRRNKENNICIEKTEIIKLESERRNLEEQIGILEANRKDGEEKSQKLIILEKKVVSLHRNIFEIYKRMAILKQ